MDIAFVIAYRTQITQIKKHRFTQITAGWKTDCPSPISKHEAMRVDFGSQNERAYLTWGADADMAANELKWSVEVRNTEWK